MVPASSNLTLLRLVVFVTILKPVSNLFLAWGMRQTHQVLADHPASAVTAVLDPLVLLGLSMQIVWLLSRMSLLSVADLSYVLPVTASGYVLSTILGKVFLHEHVSGSRWIGVMLISLGNVVVGPSTYRTERGRS